MKGVGSTNPMFNRVYPTYKNVSVPLSWGTNQWRVLSVKNNLQISKPWIDWDFNWWFFCWHVKFCWTIILLVDMTKTQLNSLHILSLKEHNDYKVTTIKQISNERYTYKRSLKGSRTEMQQLMMICWIKINASNEVIV